MQDISGKTAIVTGAASGIGLGIAAALAESGANVVMADIQKEAVEQAAHALSGTNKQVMPVRIDVTTEQSVIDALALVPLEADPPPFAASTPRPVRLPHATARPAIAMPIKLPGAAGWD